MRLLLFILCAFSLFGCCDDPSSKPLPPIVKCKPTWETRSLHNWFKQECNHSDCKPMGYTTVLVEFTHDGCRTLRNAIDNQAALIQGYAPAHAFLMVTASYDALTRMLFDRGTYNGTPCRVFVFDDTPKADRKIPNEDEWFVELCKSTTSTTTDRECYSELSDKRLYTP